MTELRPLRDLSSAASAKRREVATALRKKRKPEHKKQRPPSFRSQALAEIAGSAAARVESTWQTFLVNDTPEGAHKFRVAVRRLRVFLQSLASIDEAGRLKAPRAMLAEAARAVASLRDLDVLIDETVGMLNSAAPVVDLDVLVDALRSERAAERAKACVALDQPVMHALRETLQTLAAEIRECAPMAGSKRAMHKLVRRDLRRRWRKTSRDGERIDTLETEALHDVRKLLKSMRYAVVHFAGFLNARDAAAFQDVAERLQQRFGYLNDVASAKSLLRRLSQSVDQAALNCAIGYVLGVHVERAAQARRKIAADFSRLAGTRLVRELNRT